MNKKFSTLMAGFLLTSAFASAQVTLDPANLKIAEKVEPGKEYLVIQSADNKIDGEDRVLSVVADEEGNLTYKAYKLSSYDGEKTETARPSCRRCRRRNPTCFGFWERPKSVWVRRSLITH